MIGRIESHDAMKHRAYLCLLLWAMAWGGCDRAPLEDSDPRLVLFETIEGADGFVLTSPGTQVFREEAFWRTLWGSTWSITDGQGVKTPPPEIDFDHKMVIAVFWGEGYSGCSNGVEAINTIIERDGELVVLVVLLPDLGPCDAVVYQMVQLDQTDLPVVFEGDVPR